MKLFCGDCRFIGIEMDTEYFDIAKRRIEEFQLKLDF